MKPIPKTIGFDSRAITLNGNRTLLISGEMHYSRSPRQLWPALLDRSVACGLNCIASYIFWNVHEPRRDVYDFSEDRDLGHFLKLCGQRGLHIILRLGPYCCAEWNYGGFPPYLRDEPGMAIRTFNEPYLHRVEKYFRHLIAEVRPYLASRGGPVILAQVENEYSNVAKRYGPEGQRYLAWMVELTRRLGVDVPTITCEGGAPGAVECVNGFSIDAERSARHHRDFPDMPLLWTEFYPAWYDTWGMQHHLRDPRNMAFWILVFLGHGGSGFNYYMWHGGTNFGRTSMYLQATSYDFDAPLDEWGRPTLKGDYLSRLHQVLHDHAPLFLEGERVVESLPEGITRTTWRHEGRTLALLANPAQPSAQLHDASGKVLFDTARTLQNARRSFAVAPWRNLPKPRQWQTWPEPFPHERDLAVHAPQPVEQLALTADATDYCWYSSDITVKTPGTQKLEISRGGDFFYIYCDGVLVAQSQPPFHENRGPTLPDTLAPQCVVNALEMKNVDGFRHEFSFHAKPGRRRLDVLATALGLIKGDWQISGPMDTERKGIWHEVRLGGQVVRDWTMRPFLVGEQLRLAHPVNSAAWRKPGRPRACAWYATDLALSPALLKADADFRLDAGGLGKGMLFFNGRMLGRHWLIAGHGFGPDEPFLHPERHGLSLDPAGQPTQRYYHVPTAWLQAENRLVIFEEQACLPASVRLQARQSSYSPVRQKHAYLRRHHGIRNG